MPAPGDVLRVVNGTYDENPIYIFWTKEQNLYNRYNRVFVQRVNNFQSHAKLTLEPARSSGAAERQRNAGALSRSRGQAARNAGAGQSGDQNTQKGLAGRPGALASSQFGGSAYSRVTTFRGATAIYNEC